MHGMERECYGNKIEIWKYKYIFVRGENGGVLIDTDYAGTLSAFYKELKKNHIVIVNLNYFLAAYYHPKIIYYAHANEKRSM